VTSLSAFPLTWPSGQPRISYMRRSEDRFQVSLRASRDHLLQQLDLLGAKDIVVSSNMQLRNDGLPYADQREPHDPAVAVYFNRTVEGRQKPFVVACDQYRRVLGNLRAIGLTIEAMRTIQRHGSNTLLEQAFTGFAALPAASNGQKPWWEVLGVERRASAGEIRIAYEKLAVIHHPDVGGDHARMVEINLAFELARVEGVVG
jgi:hypothetical protein